MNINTTHTKPKVSVIMPVYNTGKYLRDSLESVLMQTIQDFEVYVIDDGSTDNSNDIICEYSRKDKRIHLIEQKNSGQSAARNAALERVDGEYIYFMDSDDIIAIDALEKCYKSCEKNKYEVVFFDGDIFYEKDASPLCWDYKRTYPYDENRVYVGDKLFENMLETGTHRAVPWLWLIKTDYLKRLNLRFYPGIIHEDELFSALLFLQAERVGVLHDSFVRHRIRGNSTMGKKFSMRNVNCYFIVIDQLKEFASTNDKYSVSINKYCDYTLAAVFRTAFILAFRDKMKMYVKSMYSGYLRHVSLWRQIKFLLKS